MGGREGEAEEGRALRSVVLCCIVLYYIFLNCDVNTSQYDTQRSRDIHTQIH